MIRKSAENLNLLQSQLSDLENLCANFVNKNIKDINHDDLEAAEDGFLAVLEKISNLKPSQANAVSEAFLFLSKLERIYQPKFALNKSQINAEYAELEAFGEELIEKQFKNDPILLTRHVVNHLTFNQEQKKPKSQLDQAIFEYYSDVLKDYIKNNQDDAKKSYNSFQISKIALDAKLEIQDLDFEEVKQISSEKEIKFLSKKPEIDPYEQEYISNSLSSAKKFWDDALYEMANKKTTENVANTIAEQAAQSSSKAYFELISENLNLNPKNIFIRYSNMIATAPDQSDTKKILIKGAFKALNCSLDNANLGTSREERHMKSDSICKDFDREISQWEQFNLSKESRAYFEKEKAALLEFRALLEQEKNLFETGDINKGIEYIHNINKITVKISSKLHGTAVCSSVVGTLFDINESKHILKTSAEQVEGKKFKNQKILENFVSIAKKITEDQSLLNITVDAATIVKPIFAKI